MINDSRIDIYDYLSGLMKQVSENVYAMAEPTETTESDVDDGFIVIRVGTLNDDSEFSCETYLWSRCYVTAYVPKKTRGRLNKTLYSTFENGINTIIKNEQSENHDGQYFIVPDTTISMDDDETAQKGNQFHVFTKSFIVGTDYEQE